MSSTDQFNALQTGCTWPLGARLDADGVNFAVHSANATQIELCVFDASGQQELARWRLPGKTLDVFHGYLPGAAAGLVYGFRAYGPWAPRDGHYFNPHKLLLDPYAREIVGRFTWHESHFSCVREESEAMSILDNGPLALKARVPDEDHFDWAGDAPPATPLTQSVIYEVHVKGFSRLNPALPEALRGTYAGLAHPASIAHFKHLGITALSVLPVHYHVDEERLVQMGLVNYWGYNTINFFTPDPRYAAGVNGQPVRDEFRAMVRDLHAAGIEVLLDVVYNHTAEGDGSGPCISFRGLDNTAYYRLGGKRGAQFINDTGCGNTLDAQQPAMLRLVMDSLRYWVGEMHVDGFRFDLAPILGRTDHGFDSRSAFFTTLAQDPVLARAKLIAEPWDIGPGGYQLGGFPRGWQEWNDRFRDTVRGFWLRRMGTCGEFTMRLCGSSDLFQARGREPASSLNYVVSHDGFTLRDLVSYATRHNEANGEFNQDGHNHNLSNNCGIEGPTEDPVILALRGRMQRALLATTLLAQGTPMLAAGDELGHTQQGNNNPYCQDNPTTWIDWAVIDSDLLAFTSRVLTLRRHVPPFNNHWYRGTPDPDGVPDMAWLRPDGHPLQGSAWSDSTLRSFICVIGKPGHAAGGPMLLLVNGGDEDRLFALPAGPWQMLLDSTHPRGWPGPLENSASSLVVAAYSLVLLADEALRLPLNEV
ncbi:MAG: glycogen debranching enzyme GlgX [Proteobacteria bacterium]|nr:glycogen debranching enzyme GlgX [Pseudomonadota bacterium]